MMYNAARFFVLTIFRYFFFTSFFVQTDSTMSQENKVTITLIAVVILFIVCQTPYAYMLLTSTDDVRPSNLTLGALRILNRTVKVICFTNRPYFFLYLQP